jgi:hypothetical protein
MNSAQSYTATKFAIKYFMQSKLLIYFFVAAIILNQTLIAQTDTTTKPKKEHIKSIMRDTLDGQLDFSRFLIDAKGFIPIPLIITEPALGGFGLAIVPMFLTPKKRPPGYTGYIAPDITAGFGMYTINNSWMIGGIRIGSIPGKGIKYRIGAGAANLNISFYRDFGNVDQKEFAFSVKSIPLLLSISKKITRSDVYLGIQYFFSKNTLTPMFLDSLPETIKADQLESNIGSLGAFIDWDKRDNFFTADQGFRANILYTANDNWTGSDFVYQRFSGAFTWFVPINKKWISGFRYESNFAFGDPPFYALPSLTLRGVPVIRFQGDKTYLVETEQRLDFNLRWSGVVFAGLGKAMLPGENFEEGQTAYNFGAGFRFLIARAFKIRAGIDIAKGPDSFGWYIVFGHNWNR